MIKNRLAILTLVVSLLGGYATALADVVIFSTGLRLPETISRVPAGFGSYGGQFFVNDVGKPVLETKILVVPAGGGPPTQFASDSVLPSVYRFDIGAMFLPPAFGSQGGKYLTIGYDGGVTTYAADGSHTLFADASSQPHHPGAFSSLALAPDCFDNGGKIFVAAGGSDVGGAIYTLDQDGHFSEFASVAGTGSFDAFGVAFSPASFGSFGCQLLVSEAGSGRIAAIDSTGHVSPFPTLPVSGGLRQLAFSPPGFGNNGELGDLLFVSVTTEVAGGGVFGQLLAVESDGSIKRALRVGTEFDKFDPRGTFFLDDERVLICDASDDILLATAQDFQPVSSLGLSPAHLWIGLKNSDDQGTQFDLKVQFLRNGTLVAEGLKRCITGVTRNPNLAKEAVAPFDPFAPVVVTAGDVLSLKVSARIGTNTDDTKCSGPGGSHNSAVGLRLYYDSTSRDSRFDATITPNPNHNLYLHSDGGPCPNGDGDSKGVTARFLDGNVPAGASVKCKDSGIVKFAGGNPFSAIGTWSLAPLP